MWLYGWRGCNSVRHCGTWWYGWKRNLGRLFIAWYMVSLLVFCFGFWFKQSHEPFPWIFSSTTNGLIECASGFQIETILGFIPQNSFFDWMHGFPKAEKSWASQLLEKECHGRAVSSRPCGCDGRFCAVWHSDTIDQIVATSFAIHPQERGPTWRACLCSWLVSFLFPSRGFFPFSELAFLVLVARHIFFVGGHNVVRDGHGFWCFLNSVLVLF